MGLQQQALPPTRVLPTAAGRLACTVAGAGVPSLLLFSGAGVALEAWDGLYPEIEELGTVFAWNRFGLPGSDEPAAAQAGSAVLGALRELLRHAGVGPPYVLVAHSLGGLYANLFARRHPHETAGVLFIEAAHPDDTELLQRHEEQLAHALEKVTALPQPMFRANVQAELACVQKTVREIASAGDFPPVPLRVVTGGLTPRSTLLSPAAIAAQRAHQQALARLSPLGAQVIAQSSGHFPQRTEPQLVLSVLRELVASWRASHVRP
jgi:pimeloyl-ACP methyl ester carboxylesterase